MHIRFANCVVAMAGDKVPSIQALEKPEDLKTLLREDRGDDCLSCRLVGEFWCHFSAKTGADALSL